MTNEVAQAKQALTEAGRVTIVGHVRPDGDSIGSVLALALALRAQGIEATPVIPQRVIAKYRFLPGAELVVENPTGSAPVVALDTAELKRIDYPNELEEQPLLNIDHHPTNTQFARYNIIDPQAASTTQVLQAQAQAFGWEVDSAVATNLLFGLITDTLGFRTPSTSPEVLRLVAQWTECGAPLHDLYLRGVVQRTFDEVRLWAFAIQRIKNEAGLIWSSLRESDRLVVGYPGKDDANFIDLMTTLQEMQVAVLLIEQNSHQVKVSWRARTGYNVAEVAEAFGGGGHHLAAGAMIQGDFEQIQEQVLVATRALISNQRSTG